MPTSTPLLTPISILMIALYFTIPVIILILLARVIRFTVTPQQRQLHQKLDQIVDLLQENNRLLSRLSEGKPADPKSE